MKTKRYTLATFKKDARKMRGFWCQADEMIVSYLDRKRDFTVFGLAHGYVKTKDVGGRVELYWTEKGMTDLVTPYKESEKGL